MKLTSVEISTLTPFESSTNQPRTWAERRKEMTPKLTLNQMIANQMNVNPPVDYTLLNDWVTTTFCTPGYPLAQVAAGITAVLQNFLFRVPYDAYQPLVNRLTGIFLAKLPALLAYQLKIQQVNA